MPDEFVSDTCLYAVVGAAAFLGTQHILILYINTSWPVGVWFGVGERLGTVSVWGGGSVIRSSVVLGFVY